MPFGNQEIEMPILTTAWSLSFRTLKTGFILADSRKPDEDASLYYDILCNKSRYWLSSRAVGLDSTWNRFSWKIGSVSYDSFLRDGSVGYSSLYEGKGITRFNKWKNPPLSYYKI